MRRVFERDELNVVDYKGAEKGKECFDELSMNGNSESDFNSISVRPERCRRAPMRKLNSRRI
jgi:hypothetical protein